VLRLLRGESLEAMSRELGVTAARLSQWRDAFMDSGTQGLKSRVIEDADDGERQRLQAKIGELTMENELLYRKVDLLEGGRPLAIRRSRR
jgi:SAM-dependent MidA family methyltransferase